MLIARLSALKERDAKKMVALSTLRQLGVIVISIGVGAPLIAFFHLLSHAFFKALLFVATGSLIHNSESYQDLQTIGIKRATLPFLRSILVISSARLCGIPFMSAFYSKEPILEILCLRSFNLLRTRFFMIGIGITILYSTRFITFTLLSPPVSPTLTFVRERDSLNNLRILILFPLAITGGSVLRSFLGLSLRLK